MNALEKHLQQLNPSLFSKFLETKQEVNLLLGKYSDNFKTYTDHSINHTMEVFEIASEILNDEEMNLLNSDETYILSMSCLLHDIGMCVPKEKIKEISETKDLIDYKNAHPNLTEEEFLRDIHHILSNKFIKHEWALLKIPSEKYAKAIGLVSQGHRKVELGNFDLYDPQYFAKSGKEFACLPYLAAILRIADELDITNSRTPRILVKYYMPNNEISIREWSKHIATSQRNYLNNKVIFEVTCSDQNIYAALQEQNEKIQNVINYGQKIIRSIPYLKEKHYSLELSNVEFKYNFEGFDPKGIKFSFDVQNVVNAFIGEDLYKDNLTSLREAIQNSIDSCRYNIKVLKNNYIPKIKVIVNDSSIIIEDNGAGMDLFIIENFFGRLASSFYEQEKVKTQFEAIGQFGVGVFSYFLLSEFIDIESKSKNNKALKFRFDKDPKSYFHFYDNVDREEIGTTICMNLKKEFQGKFDFNTIEKYIRSVFKHVEIPIELTDCISSTIIESVKFEIDHKIEIYERLKLQDRNLSQKFKIIDAKINNSEFEGICGLIVAKSAKDIFSYGPEVFDRETFNTNNNRPASSQISISQKGIFVNNYSLSTSNLIIGSINLKKKIKINLDRNSFSDTEPIKDIILEFETLIFEKIFNQIEKKYNSDIEKITVTENFLINYFTYIVKNENSQKFISILRKFLYVEVFFNEKRQVINLENLYNLSEEIIIANHEEDERIIYEVFKKPLVLLHGKRNYEFSRYESLISNILPYQKMIFYWEGNGYIKMKKNAYDINYYNNIRILYLITGRYYEFMISNSKLLYVTYSADKNSAIIFGDYKLNYNHHFVQFLLKHSTEITHSTEIKKIIKAGLSYLNESLDSGRHNEEYLLNSLQLKKVNEILKPLSKFGRFRNLKLSDFKK